MRNLNAYQQDVLTRLNGEGRVNLARRVYTGWMNGINERIPVLPLRHKRRGKRVPMLGVANLALS